MTSLLEQVEELDQIIHRLKKMESRMRAGAWIDAWRECNSLIASLNKARKDLIVDSERKNNEQRED